MNEWARLVIAYDAETSAYDAYVDFLERMGVWLRMTPPERVAYFILRLFSIRQQWIFDRFREMRARQAE